MEDFDQNEYKTMAQKRKSATGKLFWIAVILLLVVIISLEAVLISKRNKKNVDTDNTEETQATAEVTIEPTPTATPYVIVNEGFNTIDGRFNAPEGYEKVQAEKNSFGEYIKNYELKDYGTKAVTYSGAVSDSSSILGVLAQKDELIKNQQCADTAIMLYAEYLYEMGQYDKIVFNFNSGFKLEFTKWAQGYRDSVNGNKVTWVDKRGTEGVTENDYSYENLVKYLKEVYVYANTDSLSVQFSKKDFSDIKAGDVFIVTYLELKNQAKEQLGEDAASTVSYGHAMIVADVAVNAEGEKMFMLIEGTTPATEPCVVENPATPGSPWFKLSEDGTFVKSSSGIKWQSSWLYSFE